MSAAGYEVRFGGAPGGGVPNFPPIRLAAGASLAADLDILNCPVLFGCRTGICGTCLSDVEGETLSPPHPEEREMLELYAPNNPKARLVCRLRAQSDLTITPLRRRRG